MVFTSLNILVVTPFYLFFIVYVFMMISAIFLVNSLEPDNKGETGGVGVITGVIGLALLKRQEWNSSLRLCGRRFPHPVTWDGHSPSAKSRSITLKVRLDGMLFGTFIHGRSRKMVRGRLSLICGTLNCRSPTDQALSKKRTIIWAGSGCFGVIHQPQSTSLTFLSRLDF